MLDPLHEGCTICIHIRFLVTQRLALCAIIDPADSGLSACKIAPCFRVLRVEKREAGRVRFRIRFDQRIEYSIRKITVEMHLSLFTSVIVCVEVR